MNTLFIDTSDNKNVSAMLSCNEKKYISRSNKTTSRPDSIVNLIFQVLKDANIEVGEIDEIKVNEGPGSYTGLKVGASVANALSFTLGKRVNGKKLGTIVEPKYE